MKYSKSTRGASKLRWFTSTLLYFLPSCHSNKNNLPATAAFLLARYCSLGTKTTFIPTCSLIHTTIPSSSSSPPPNPFLFKTRTTTTTNCIITSTTASSSSQSSTNLIRLYGKRGGGAAADRTTEKSKDKKPSSRISKSNLPEKICVVCNRPFTWRKKWERCWDEVTCCSKSCNAKRRGGNTSTKNDE